MALIGISQPPALLDTPGEPTMLYTTWIQMFENYLLALTANDMPDKRKRALLLHCLGTEGQRIFLSLPDVGTSYKSACDALKAFFVPRVNVVAERNKFRRRAQRQGESIVQYIAALRDLLVNCDFGLLADDMIRDQLIEKTSSSRIRERLLLEADLTLQKAITLASHIETAVADAKAIASVSEASVQLVQPRGGGAYQRQTEVNSHATRPQTISDPQRTSQQKACYRCGSTSHLANNQKCAAKNSKCNQCGKIGHFAKVCRSTVPTQTVQEVAVPDLTVLHITPTSAVSQIHRLTCTVSLHDNEGQSLTTDLLVDTGSAVSILPESVYLQTFMHVPLTKPTVRLVTYMKKPIPVLGCLHLSVTYCNQSTQTHFYVVRDGTSLLGMDLFTALRLHIQDGQITTPSSTTSLVTDQIERRAPLAHWMRSSTHPIDFDASCPLDAFVNASH
ncbi:hypothetical protein N1851_019189 [Merluccius polli]|uniref:CCHC-type domain-containing protein n=1 Tax=Merluccius polli TaxID=89951 RepID=A0AA47NZV4_MERPO|nr:hypothetical protein N1851_019189 [Merluccius polli]